MKTYFDRTNKSTIILIIVVILLAVSLVILNCFSDHDVVSKQDLIDTESNYLESDVRVDDLEEVLPFREDVARFLQVYDTEQFETKAEFEDFLSHEYRRFSAMSLSEKEYQKIRNDLVSSLEVIIEKSKLGQTDFPEQDQILLKIKQDVEK